MPSVYSRHSFVNFLYIVPTQLNLPPICNPASSVVLVVVALLERSTVVDNSESLLVSSPASTPTAPHGADHALDVDGTPLQQPGWAAPNGARGPCGTENKSKPRNCHGRFG